MVENKISVHDITVGVEFSFIELLHTSVVLARITTGLKIKHTIKSIYFFKVCIPAVFNVFALDPRDLW